MLTLCQRYMTVSTAAKPLLLTPHFFERAEFSKAAHSYCTANKMSDKLSSSYSLWVENCYESFQDLSEEEQGDALLMLISKCDIKSRIRLSKFCYDFINLDFLVKLPLEVLEYIVNYLPVVDALIACHTSAMWNEHITLLHHAWKMKWKELCMNGTGALVEPEESWKGECQRAVALLLKFPALSMLNPPEEFTVKIHITTMDVCDNLLLCFGNQAQSSDPHLYATQKNVAYVYKKARRWWTLVTVFEIEQVRFCVLCCCIIPNYTILAGGHDGVLVIWQLDEPSGNASQVASVQAHASSIGTVCADQNLQIAVTAGRDSRVKIWSLENGSHLKSFTTSRVCEVSVLSGDKSPFIGYNCLLIRKSGDKCTIAMACWGQNIPLADALYTNKVSRTQKYDGDQSPWTILPNVTVQGGSLVYGFKQFIRRLRCEVCILIWQPIDPDDLITIDTNVAKEELENFRGSLHPRRKDCFIALPQRTTGIHAVGLCFSVVVCHNSTFLTVVVNSTGDSENLLDARVLFNKTDENGKMVNTKWLDGVEAIEPGAVCFVKAIGQERILTSTWRDDAFSYENPTLSQLLNIREHRRSVLEK